MKVKQQPKQTGQRTAVEEGHWKVEDIYASRVDTLQKRLELIREAINRFGDSTIGKEKAARYLGISRATLYRRLKEIALWNEQDCVDN